MIEIQPKPFQTVSSYRGKIELDEVYDFVVEKKDTVPPTDEDKYEVHEIKMEKRPEQMVSGAVADVIEGAIINHCKKHGIGE